MIQNFVFGDGVFIILFCSLRGSISQNTGTHGIAYNKYLNKENLLFLTILNYFRQILVALNYFVQSDWRTMVHNLELTYKK
jgi:hypothetical protein